MLRDMMSALIGALQNTFVEWPNVIALSHSEKH